MGPHVKEKWVRNLEDCEKRPTFAVAFEEGAAQVAELVDALVSGTSNSNVVQVRFLSWALRGGDVALCIAGYVPLLRIGGDRGC